MLLIDTDIIIYSLKGDPTVTDNFDRFKSTPKSISVITYGELQFGAANSKQRTNNLAKIRRITELFPIVDLTPGIMDVFGQLKTDLRKSGATLDDFDLLIAATAMYLNYTLVTNNKRHFSRIIDLKVENWKKL